MGFGFGRGGCWCCSEHGRQAGPGSRQAAREGARSWRGPAACRRVARTRSWLCRAPEVFPTWLGDGVCKMGQRGGSPGSCWWCVPARWHRPEMGNWSKTVLPRQNLSSVWPKKDNRVEDPGQALPLVRLR